MKPHLLPGVTVQIVNVFALNDRDFRACDRLFGSVCDECMCHAFVTSHLVLDLARGLVVRRYVGNITDPRLLEQGQNLDPLAPNHVTAKLGPKLPPLHSCELSRPCVFFCYVTVAC